MGEGIDPSSSGLLFGGAASRIDPRLELTPRLRPPDCAAFEAQLRSSKVVLFDALLNDNRALELCGSRQLAVDLYARDPYPDVPVSALRGSRGLIGGTVTQLGMIPSQQALAEALIATGQLELGPEAFASPAASAALATALGGRMSSPFLPSAGSMFGLSGNAPGSSFPLMPFGQGGFGGFTGPMENPFGAGSIIGALGGAAINIGSAYLAQQIAEKQREEEFKRARELLMLQAQLGLTRLPEGMFPGGMQGGQMSAKGVKLTPDGRLVGCIPGPGDPGCSGPVWDMPPGSFNTGGGFPGGSGGACGPRGPVTVSPIDAPALYTTGCSGTRSTRSRFFALRNDGTRDLFVRVGKVQSVSPRALTRFARRWAREAGLTTQKRGAGVRRGRRRPR